MTLLGYLRSAFQLNDCRCTLSSEGLMRAVGRQPNSNKPEVRSAMKQQASVLLEEEGYPFIRFYEDKTVVDERSGRELKHFGPTVFVWKDNKSKTFSTDYLWRKYFHNELKEIPPEDQCSLESLGFPNYIILRDGRIWNKRTYQMITGAPNNSGYYCTYLRFGYTGSGSLKSVKIHRLVALAFVPNPNKLLEVNHTDGNKANNAADNLEWCSAYDNHLHARIHGLRKSAMTEEQVHAVCKRIQDGMKLTAISRELNVPVTAIQHIVAHGTHRHIAEQYGIPYKKPIRLTPIDYSRYKKRRSSETDKTITGPTS